MPLAATAEPYLAEAVPTADGRRVGVVHGCSRTTERVLENSYHVATLDDDAPVIFEESSQFVRRVTGP